MSNVIAIAIFTTVITIKIVANLVIVFKLLTVRGCLDLGSTLTREVTMGGTSCWTEASQVFSFPVITEWPVRFV